jgi:hypothetical protein
MLHFLRFSSLPLLLFSLLFLTTSSCKKQESVPEDLSGSLDATISPAGSIYNVLLTAQGTSNIVASGEVDPTGYVKIKGVAAGNYVVTYSPATGYTAPAPQNVTITAKTNTALGTVQITKAPPLNTPVSYALQGTASWSSNLVAFNTLNTATAASTTGYVTLYNGAPFSIIIKAVYQSGTLAETVELTAGYYSGVGQYSLGNITGGGSGTYLRTSSGTVTDSYNTAVTGVQGTLTILTHDLTKRTITGTFGYNGYNTRGVKEVVVGNGAFSLSY